MEDEEIKSIRLAIRDRYREIAALNRKLIDAGELPERRITEGIMSEANYNEQVKFTATNRYGCGPDDEDDVYTIAEFKALCQGGMFIDYDGFGYPVKDSLADSHVTIKPSKLERDIPPDATHVVWYNR